jgi:hypothetical protein
MLRVLTRIAARDCIRRVSFSHTLFIGFGWALVAAAHAQRPPPNISADRDLIEINLAAWDCLNKPGGTARTPDGIERNILKNRSATDVGALKLPDLDVAAFVQSVGPFDTLTMHKRRKDLGPAEKQQLEPMEKKIVQVTGYLGIAYCGPPETTNCASVDFHDWHLEVFEKPPDHPPQVGDFTPIICEITPRTQNAIYADKVRIQGLTAFFRRPDLTYEATGHPARRIRITGYRLWDDEHNGTADVGTTIRRANPNRYHNPWRQTAWEIHPVIKIVPVDSAAVSQSVTPEPSSFVAPTIAPSPSIMSEPATPTPTPAPVVKTPQIQPQFVTITAPVTIQIPYGQTILQRGTKLTFVSHDSQTVTVEYMGEKYPIPTKSTDFEAPSPNIQAPENH